jgi:hypothetical protein
LVAVVVYGQVERPLTCVESEARGKIDPRRL